MRKTFSPLLAIALLGFVASAKGQAAGTMTVQLQYGYQGYFHCQDTVVYHGGPDRNLGLAADLGRNFPQEDNLLFWFDVSWLPKTVTVSGAELKLFNESVGWSMPTQHQPGPVGLFEIAKPWVEGIGENHKPEEFPTGATFLTRDGLHTWDTPGADFHPRLLSKVITEGPPGKWYSWPVPPDVVQEWIASTRPNHGVLLHTLPGFPGKGMVFHMKEFKERRKRPKLVIQLRATPEERSRIFALRRGMLKHAKATQANAESGRRTAAKHRVAVHKAELARAKAGGKFLTTVKPGASFIVGMTHWRIEAPKALGKTAGNQTARGTFVRIGMRAVNWSGKPVSFAAPRLVDATGRSHAFSLAATGQVDKATIVRMQTLIQRDVRFSLVYDVPALPAQTFLSVPDLKDSQTPHTAVDLGTLP